MTAQYLENLAISNLMMQNLVELLDVREVDVLVQVKPRRQLQPQTCQPVRLTWLAGSRLHLEAVLG